MNEFPDKLIFLFYRYVQPVWYFNLKSKNNIPYWVDYRKLTSEDQDLITFDKCYSCEEASLRDASYQAWQKGILCFDPTVNLHFDQQLPLRDEYRFIKKHFNSFWFFYVFLVRLLSLKNPFKEAFAFFSVFNVQRVDLYAKTKKWSTYQAFRSPLIETKPFVSVVIPTLNRYSYLNDVLRDLEMQDYEHFELLVFDQSEPFNSDFYKGWQLDIKVIPQQEKALWKARNAAIEMAKGEFVLLYDDDSRVENNWISEHLRCLDFFDADFSAGVSLSVIGAKIPKSYSFLRWADQLDTGNVMIKKEVFRKVGLFDRQFERQRMGDGEFGLRAYLAGFVGISNPYAKRIHLKVASGGLRQMGSWDGFRPTSWLAPRPIPSVLYLTRKYFGVRTSALDLLIKVPPSISPLKHKRSPAFLIFASFLSMFLLPLLFYQVIKSWQLSSKMLTEGPKIDILK